MTERVPDILILGIGNPDRGDDGAGSMVARLLTNRFNDEVTVATHSGEATSLLARMEEVRAIYLVDACAPAGEPGRVHRLDAHDAAFPSLTSDVSTHGFGLGAAIELARALGQLPAQSIVFAIEGLDFTTGAALSPPVAAATHVVADTIAAELAHHLKEKTHA